MHIRSIKLLHHLYPTRDFYPFNLSLLQETDVISVESPITFFMGENGTGKSTLLRAIADKTQIHVWEEQQIRRLERNPYEHQLNRAIEVEWTSERVPGSYFGSQFFNHFTHLLEEWATADPGQINYFGGHSLMTLSHGQSLLAFFQARYAVRGLYLLDEPETALSPSSQLALLKLLRLAIDAGKAQFIIVTHSPILLALPGARILNFNASPIDIVVYQDTEYYQFYKSFLNNPESFFDS